MKWDPTGAFRYTAPYLNQLETMNFNPTASFKLAEGLYLGLGADGHTASLIPQDPVLDVLDQDVALTGVYQHRRRMTLTFSLINRSRLILWLATGAAKVPMIQRLLARDLDIPAGRIDQGRAILLADRSAARPMAGQE